MDNVVIVESPAKAKTINKYLGKDYTVLASYGHVRDLPPKDGSVRPDEQFAMSWSVEDRAEKRLKEIARAVKGAKHLFLATDPDREGEAISWHIEDVLRQRHALKGVDVKRVVFHEITKQAVQDAFKHPRDVNQELVDAYLARRALDYLVGFTLSPVLWRKLPGSRSAGRVQSVALRLICEREDEIEAFKAREYWTIEAEFETAKGDRFTARLTHLDGKKLDKFDIGSEAKARDAADKIARAAGFAVTAVEKRQVRRNPGPPFTTSTLQQEASRKLGFGASRTMRVAQRLYEDGYITYMRTDGVTLANEAVAGARRLIAADFGNEYLPDKPRQYTARAKNAQEAHEAIRPTDLFQRPAQVARDIDGDGRALYELIWKRTTACQMEAAVIDQVSADIDSADKSLRFRATGSTILFDGFLKLYREDVDDPGDEEEGGRLPALAEREALNRGKVTPAQHFTEPPPRYSEASIVRKLEELGIGRPSTYASILSVLRERAYVRMDRNRFVPEDKGRIVTGFLKNFFNKYVQYDFTADLEEKLDEVSNGSLGWKQLLREFWKDFSSAIDEAKDLRVSEVITALDEVLGPHIFPADGNVADPRACPTCGDGRLSLKLGRFGAFIGCSNYPECRYTRKLGQSESEAANEQPAVLGNDPETGEPISVRSGRFGPYVQRGEGEKPARGSVPKGVDPSSVDLAYALKLLSLPREVGKHPETGEPITANFGRYGPYVAHQGQYASLESADEVFTVGINRAVSLIADRKAKTKSFRGPEPLKELGAVPGGAAVKLMRGRYGPYVTDGTTNATLPRDVEPLSVTLDQAVSLIAARVAKGDTRPAKKARGKAATATKPSAKGKKGNGRAKSKRRPAGTESG